MIPSRLHPRNVLVAGAVLLVGATLLVAALVARPAGAGSKPDPAPAASRPDWFVPIWKYYGRNPRVTPDFRFADLYSTKARGVRPSTHAHAG